MLIDLRGKVALVTGAGRGIGRVIAATLAAEGAVTHVTDLRPDLLDDVAAEWARRRWPGRGHHCDARDGARIAEVVEAMVAAHGRLDILVNNAGVAPGGPVEALTEEIWDLNQDVNCKGTFLACRAVIPVMKTQRSGRIINAASFAAILPIAGAAAYAASKAGVHYFTRVLAGELGPWNITVNCYAPGMIPTEMNHFAEAPAAHQRRLLDTLTLRRWGSAEDVANLVCFLASDLAGYITGTMIDVSGGKLATQIPRLPWETAAGAGVAALD
ncbi:MAG TPA: SDR family NAD(P)-dependent oxidoreductase [Methylomirabilota bacterium]|nr:SDR family NAD(P)-dependent oxidoreductase [Methylomirabilota bacterium]